MWNLTALLTCALVLGCVGTSVAEPLDSPDIVYIDGIPCNRPCQAFMDWSRSLLPQQETPATEQSAPSQVIQRAPKLKAQRPARILKRAPRALPSRVAKKAAPKSTEASQSGVIEEGKSTPPETITGSLPVPDPASGSETGTTSGQGLTAPAVENLTTSNQAPAQKLDNDTPPSSLPEAAPPADVETTALAPGNAEQLVAILLARPEIKSVSDLANKTVAIDVLQSDSVARVRIAIVAAGAAEVQMSEGSTLAFERVLDGEVPAAVVSVVHPKAADAWSAGRPGFKIFRIPLSPAPL